MTPEQFAWWLSGVLSCNESLSEEQTKVVSDKLSECFHHSIDPSHTSHLPVEVAKEIQKELQATHDKHKSKAQAKPGEKPLFRC